MVFDSPAVSYTPSPAPSTPSESSSGITFATERSSIHPQKLLDKKFTCVSCQCFCATLRIYECENRAHLTCAICHDNQRTGTKCGECEAGPLRRSIFAESLLEDFKFPCPNKEIGCSETITPVTAQHHITADCKYRSVTCFHQKKSTNTACWNTIPMNHYVSHLAEHKDVEFLNNRILPDSSRKGWVGFLVLKLKHVQLKENKESEQYWTNIQHVAATGIEFDNQQFVMHAVIYNRMIHIWVMLLGNQLTASKYTSDIRFGCTTSKKAVVDLFNPVLPFHTDSTFDEYAGHYASIYAAKASQLATADKKLFLKLFIRNADQTHASEIRCLTHGEKKKKAASDESSPKKAKIVLETDHDEQAQV